MLKNPEELAPAEIKSCCANFYENEAVRRFMGDTFHPGGEQLTQALGERLGLNKNSKVLDVACGPGSSAAVLVKWFDCEVTGVDLSEKNLEKAKRRAEKYGVENKIEFVVGDAEKLKFDDRTFDAVICECALCTFPDKETAVSEMYRVLKKGGKLGITDVIIEGELPKELNNILTHILCLAGAVSIDSYKKLFTDHGFHNIEHEDWSHTLTKLIKKGERMLGSINVVERMFNFKLETLLGITKEEAKDLIVVTREEVEKGNVGYGMFTAEK
jgi:ubiquinone/menaquinone biosynthesis C-methylase UbiE